MKSIRKILKRKTGKEELELLKDQTRKQFKEN